MDDSKQTFDYKPSDGSEEPKKRVGSVSWSASEYIDHQQGVSWYAVLGLLTIALAGILYFWTHDYFAVGTILVVGILVGSFAKRTPQKMDYNLSSDGLQIGEKLYSFSQFKSFAVIEEGAISSVELMPLKKFMPPISVFFATKDQNKIVAILSEHLPLEEKQLDQIERLSRRLRF